METNGTDEESEKQVRKAIPEKELDVRNHDQYQAKGKEKKGRQELQMNCFVPKNVPVKVSAFRSSSCFDLLKPVSL